MKRVREDLVGVGKLVWSNDRGGPDEGGVKLDWGRRRGGADCFWLGLAGLGGGAGGERWGWRRVFSCGGGLTVRGGGRRGPEEDGKKKTMAMKGGCEEGEYGGEKKRK